MEKKRRFSATTCRSGTPGKESSAPISSATAARRAPSNRCWKTCSSAGLPATTIACSTSARPSPEIYFLCQPCLSSTPLARTQLPPYPNQHRWNLNQKQRKMARSTSGHSREIYRVNNLHRELAPISDAAWDQIEDEV